MQTIPTAPCSAVGIPLGGGGTLRTGKHAADGQLYLYKVRVPSIHVVGSAPRTDGRSGGARLATSGDSVLIPMDLRLSNECSAMVQRWLGPRAASSKQKQPETAGGLDFAPRAERLGLGAKYVPHSAALSAGERRFANKLSKGKTDVATSRATTGAQLGKQAPVGKRARAQDADHPSSDDDSEEMGRASAFRLRKARGKPSASEPTRRATPMKPQSSPVSTSRDTQSQGGKASSRPRA